MRHRNVGSLFAIGLTTAVIVLLGSIGFFMEPERTLELLKLAVAWFVVTVAVIALVSLLLRRGPEG